MERDLAAQHFEGFRIWRLDVESMTLHSIAGRTTFTPWLPGMVMEAECIHAKHHGKVEPAWKCGCGMWAVKSRRAIHRTYPTLAATKAEQYRDELERKRQKKVVKAVEKRRGIEVSFDQYLTPAQQAVLQQQLNRLIFPAGSRHPRSPLAPREYIVSGRVQMWGTVIEHTWGYRAQFAQIIPGTLQWWPRMGKWFKPQVLQHLRDKYNVEVAHVLEEQEQY